MKSMIHARLSSKFTSHLYSIHVLIGSLLSYAFSELQKDVEKELLSHPETERCSLLAATKFGIFVVHNKIKPKLAELPSEVP
jgi:hypothetical protein